MTDRTVALAGNPNVGKTTVFNALTGSRQQVGNWPGKTVERKHGTFNHDGLAFEVVDLPGAYSLTAFSLEEAIARDFILEARPDVVVAVADASNLERNLYLIVQLLEMGANLIVALNMSDQADSLGYHIDLEALSGRLGGAPVVRMVASRGAGIVELKHRIAALCREKTPSRQPVNSFAKE